jgi:hypothetical protein
LLIFIANKRVPRISPMYLFRGMHQEPEDGSGQLRMSG